MMKNYLKKIFLILIIGLICNHLNSQEIQSIYKFKKKQKKKLFYYYELDSLVLYKNGEFYRKRLYQYHEISYLELRGNWKIENGILFLNIQRTRKIEQDWEKLSGKFTYFTKNKKLIPTNDGFKYVAHKKLKLVK